MVASTEHALHHQRNAHCVKHAKVLRYAALLHRHRSEIIVATNDGRNSNKLNTFKQLYFPAYRPSCLEHTARGDDVTAATVTLGPFFFTARFNPGKPDF